MQITTSRAARAALCIASIAIHGGCASVSVHKVDPKTGAIVQGAAEGLRFYLPRPYVSVFEPFIVSSDVYLARGELSPDGNYVLLTEVPTGLGAIVNPGLKDNKPQGMGDLAIDAGRVFAVPSVRGGPQSASADEEKKDDEAAKDDKGKEGDKPKDADKKDTGKEEKKEPPTALPGILSYKATNDNAAFAVTPQPRYFNVLWLPDFDEQYVVTAKPGFGNSGVVLNFGQGWSLQGLDAKVDNSAAVKPLLDFYSSTIGALQKVATAKIQGPLAMLGGGPQSKPATGDKTAKSEFKGGTPVTVKVTRVRIAAPGLYPILKPREMETLPAERSRILAPVPPLTNVAFNTYDAVVIEAARATGDTALRIHQYVDSTAPGAAQPGTPGTAGGPTPTPANDLAAPQKALNVELSKPGNKTKKGEFYEATVTRDGNAVKVLLRKRTGTSQGTRDALPDAAAVRKIVADTLKKQGVEVTADNVVIPG